VPDTVCPRNHCHGALFCGYGAIGGGAGHLTVSCAQSCRRAMWWDLRVVRPAAGGDGRSLPWPASSRPRATR
jgi:hypothetical protein